MGCNTKYGRTNLNWNDRIILFRIRGLKPIMDVAGASDSVREPFDITAYIAGAGNGGFACICLEVACVYVSGACWKNSVNLPPG